MSNVKSAVDIAPTLSFELTPMHFRGAEYISAVILAGPADDLAELLALAAVDAIEERDAYRVALSVATRQLHEAHIAAKRQQARIIDLIAQLRVARRGNRRAA